MVYMDFVISVVLAIILSICASSFTDYFYRRIMSGSIFLVLMLVSMFGFPLLVFIAVSHWFAYFLLGALLHKYFGRDPRARIVDLPEFRRKYGNTVNTVSNFLFCMGIVSLLFDLYLYFFD